ncbi:hypothetical protein ANN_08442 [Periplaneta americana]|uniref:Uncharacterized protein n=1 Tax=Periplaneta americana TaxID=6978 RepID=A0ABQ8T237_PERAM|nr:hypothetical protein ANN_08442 [Periplaneta americana]
MDKNARCRGVQCVAQPRRPGNTCDNAGEISPESSTESYPAFAHLGLRENPGKNLNQVTCPDRESNPGHLISRPDVLTVTPQPVKGLDRPAGYWPHAHMPKQRWTIIQPERRYRVVSTMIPPAVIIGIRNRISLPIAALQVHHDAGWAPVTYTGRNFMRKFLLPRGLEPARIP